MKVLLSFVFTLSLAAETVPTVAVEARDLLMQTTQPVTAEPFYVAAFGSMVTGYVAKVAVDIGDRVKAGQSMATVSVPDLEAHHLSQKAEVRRVSTEIAAMQARLNAAKSEAARIVQLVKSGTVTPKAGEEATERLEAAEAELLASEARLASAQARMAETQAILDYATIKAPFDGVVISRDVDPGDLVTKAGKAGADGKTLFEVARTDILRVVAHLPEREAVHVDIGDVVEITFDALPGKILQSSVSRKAFALDPDTQRMRVEIDLPNMENDLVAGAFGRAVITLVQKKGAIVIPASALRPTAKGPLVYVVEGGRIRHQVVKLGLDSGEWIEVSEGLEVGQMVVSGRVERLADGATVETR